MNNSSENRGVTGKLEVSFAIPTDDPKTWRLKSGTLTFANGATVGIDVEGGYIPHFKGNHGLTVTYCVFASSIKRNGSHATADVAMMTCIDGKVMEANDIAAGVEVLLPQDWVAALSGESGAHTSTVQRVAE